LWKWRGRGNPKKQDFTPPLGKASQKTCSAFPHFHKPGDIYFPIQRRRKLASHLTEVIHFGNDFISSVASLRSLDAFHWNRWRLSIGITGGIRRNTHLKLLYACIAPSMDSTEFFLRKAIGWALRQYAWTDPVEIARYVRAHDAALSPLSKREALKHRR